MQEAAQGDAHNARLEPPIRRTCASTSAADADDVRVERTTHTNCTRICATDADDARVRWPGWASWAARSTTRNRKSKHKPFTEPQVKTINFDSTQI